MQPEAAQQQAEAETTYYQAIDGDAPETVPEDGPSVLPQVEPIQWRAAEYIQHIKSPLWYVVFAIVVIILMVLAIFLMQSPTFAILLPIMAGALMVYSHRPAQEVMYVLSEQGLYINDQLHPLVEFKSFGIMQSEPLHMLVLTPTKRFRPNLSVYFPTEVGEAVVDLLGGYLPMQDVKPDLFDAIVHKLKM